MNRASLMRSTVIGCAALLAATLPSFAAAAIAPAYRVPTPEVRTLSNGLRVVVFTDHRLGVVQVLARMPGGVDAEPATQSGVAYLTAQLLMRGTTSRDAATITRELNRIGGAVQAAATRDVATMSGAFVASQLESGLELMSDMLINPLFPEADVRRLANQNASGILKLHQSPAATAEEQVWPLALEGRPASRPVLGTTASLLSLGREQVRLFHRDRYRPDRSVLILAGDITMDRAMALANEWFGRWSGKTADPPAPEPVAAGPRVRIVDIPGAPECEVRVALAVPGRRAGDEVARALAGQMFELDLAGRARRAGAARSSMVLLRDSGVWAVGGSAPADSAGVLASRLRAELRKFITAPPGAEAVSAARSIAVGAYPLRFETLNGLVAQWSTADDYGLGADYLQKVPDKLAAMSSPEMAAALKANGSLDRLVVLAVGPADRLKRALASLGPAEVLSLDAVATAGPQVSEAPATPAEIARGRRLIEQSIEAHGGLAKLRGIHDSVIDAEVTLNMQGNQLTGDMRQIRKDPDKMVYTTDFQGIESRQVLNGRTGWIRQGDTNPVRDSDSASVAALRSGFSSDLPHLLLTAADSSSRVAARATERVGDVQADAVDVMLRGGDRRRLFFDPASHRLIAMDVSEQVSRAGALPSRRYYRDYRPVAGVLWPHEEERLLAGNPFMTIRVSSIVVNIGVDDREFAKPGAPGVPPGR